MEIMEAIEIIKRDKKSFEMVNHGGFTNKIDAFDFAIKALENQITLNQHNEEFVYISNKKIYATDYTCDVSYDENKVICILN